MRPQVVHLRSHRTLRYAEGNVLSPPTLSPDTWYHQAASWNTDFATNEKVFQIYLNGANLGAVNNEDTTGGATPAQWSYYAPGYGGVTLVVRDLLNDGSYGPATTTTMADFPRTGNFQTVAGKISPRTGIVACLRSSLGGVGTHVQYQQISG
jgi:hypothetical protein